MSAKYVLELKNIFKSFSNVNVLEDVTVSVEKGSILGLCGENGAGKSTLMNILGGIHYRDGGSMKIDGEKYNPKSARDAQKAGIAFIHQELNLFLNLKVIQNFMIDDPPVKKISKMIDLKEIRKVAKKSLEALGMEIDLDTYVSDLAISQRQLVEIAKEVSKDVKIVIFDEPTTSLSNTEKVMLFKIIKKLSEKGIAIIYISHILDDVFALCDNIMVIRDGKKIGEDRTCNLNKEKVISMMVGRVLSTLYPYVEKNVSDEVMRISDVNQGKRLKNVSLSLRKGEIVGLFGLMGAGRSELVNAIFGVDQFDSGQISIDDEQIHDVRPSCLKKAGVAYVTESRHEDGLLLTKSIKDNLVLANLNKLKKKSGFMDKVKESDICDKMIKEVNIKTFNKNTQTATQLSGGNQQKVVIGKWLMTKPRVFLMDEPTRGVDVGAKYEIYNRMNELALDGSAILFISSEMEELMGVCDRIIVMHNGCIAGELNRADYNQEEILKMAIGGNK